MRRTNTDQDHRIIQLKEDLEVFKAYYVNGLWARIFFWKKRELSDWVELIEKTLNNANEPKLTAEEVLVFVRAADGARGFSWWPSQFRRRIREYCPDPYTASRVVDERNSNQNALGVLAINWRRSLKGLPFPNGNKKYAKQLVKRLSYLDAAREKVDLFILALSRWKSPLGAYLPKPTSPEDQFPKVVPLEDRVNALLIKNQPQPQPQPQLQEVPDEIERGADEEQGEVVPESPSHLIKKVEPLIGMLKSNKSHLQTDFNIMGTDDEHSWYMLVQLAGILQSDLSDVKFGLRKVKKERLVRDLKAHPYGRKGKDGSFDVKLIGQDYVSFDKFCADPLTAEKAAARFEDYPDKEEKEKFTSFALKRMYIEHMVNLRYKEIESGKPGFKVQGSEVYKVVLLELFYMKSVALIETIQKVLQHIRSPKSESANLAELLNELKSLSDWLLTLSLYTQYLDYQKEFSVDRSGVVRLADFTKWFRDIRKSDIGVKGTKGILRSAIGIQGLLKRLDTLQYNKARSIFGHLETMLGMLGRSRKKRDAAIRGFRGLLAEAPKAEQSAIAEVAHQSLLEDPDTLHDLGLTEKAEALDGIPPEWFWMQRALKAIPISHVTQCDENGLTDQQASSLLRLRVGLRPVFQLEKSLDLLEAEELKRAQKEGKEHRPFSSEQRKQKQRIFEQGLLSKSLEKIFAYEFFRDSDWLNSSKLDIEAIVAIAGFILSKHPQEKRDASEIGRITQEMRAATKRNTEVLREAVNCVGKVVGQVPGAQLNLILGDLLVQSTDPKGKVHVLPNFSKCLTLLDWINACLTRLTKIAEYQFEARLRDQATYWRDAILDQLQSIKVVGRATPVFRVEDSEFGVKRIALVDHDPDARQKLIFHISQLEGLLPEGEFHPYDDLSLALEREEEIDKVHEGVLEVNRMGHDLQALVLDQGTSVQLVCDQVDASHKITKNSIKNIHDTLMIEEHGCMNWFLGLTPKLEDSPVFQDSRELIERCQNAAELKKVLDRSQEKAVAENMPTPNKSQVFPSFLSVFSLFGSNPKKNAVKAVDVAHHSSCVLR